MEKALTRDEIKLLVLETINGKYRSCAMCNEMHDNCKENMEKQVNDIKHSVSKFDKRLWAILILIAGQAIWIMFKGIGG